MQKKAAAIVLLVVISALSLAACTTQEAEPPQSVYLDYTDFIGKRVGAVTGNLSGEIISSHLDTVPAYYSEQSAGIEDVRKGRIDGFMTDLSILRVLAASPGFEDTQVIPVPAEIFAGPLGAFSMEQDIIDRFNVFLKELEQDGTLADMRGRWLDNVPDWNSPMPELPLTGENGTLAVATSGVQLPFSYFGADNELKGYSIELAIRFAAREGMDIAFASMDFSGLIPYLASGKADLGIDAVTITEERKKSVLFSDSIYDDLLGIITLKDPISGASSYTDFAGKRIGVEPGTVFDRVTEGINGEPVYYNDMSSAMEDVRKNRVDGFMVDKSIAQVFAGAPGNEDIRLIDVPAEVFTAPMGAMSVDQDMIDRFNVFLAKIVADGTLADMRGRWLDAVPDLDAPMPDIPITGENGVLPLAAYGQAMPYSFYGANGELKGYCVELAYRFAAHEGMRPEFTTMDVSGLVPYLVSKKADICVEPIYITEERKKSVLFSEPYAEDHCAILAMKTGGVTAVQTGGGFIEWLKTGIERNLITDNRWKMIVNGLGVTMVIALMAQLLGTVFGCFVCWLLTRKNRFVQWLGNLYCGLIHGTPIVVLLMITYYIVFGSTAISNVLIAIAAFTMVTGAGVAQNLRGAIGTVDPVEIEAARSIGFSAFKAFRAVTLPQAVRRALPGYTNGFVELVKATAIVGYVAIQDLMRAADIIRSRTYDAYFPLLFVAVIYLLVTTVCVQLFKLIVRNINGGEAQ